MKPIEVLRRPFHSLNKIRKYAGEVIHHALDSQYPVDRLLREQEEEKLTDAETLIRAAEALDLSESVVHQQRVVVNILAKNLLREVNREGAITPTRLLNLNRMIEDMPEGESFETVGLSEQESELIRNYISNF